MKRYRFFTDKDNVDERQRTIVEEDVLYDKDGNEVIVASRNTSVGQLEQEYRRTLDGIGERAVHADAIVDKLSAIHAELNAGIPDLAKITDSDITQPRIPKRG